MITWPTGSPHIGVLGAMKKNSQITHELRGCQETLRRWNLPLTWLTQWERCRYSMADAYEALYGAGPKPKPDGYLAMRT